MTIEPAILFYFLLASGLLGAVTYEMRERYYDRNEQGGWTVSELKELVRQMKQEQEV